MIKYQRLQLKTKQDFKNVPNPLIGLITELHIGKTAVSFKTKTGDVTISKELLKVLRKVKAIDNQDLLVLTNNLTEDARQILEGLNIDYITRVDFYWTDESYISIRQL